MITEYDYPDWEVMHTGTLLVHKQQDIFIEWQQFSHTWQLFEGSPFDGHTEYVLSSGLLQYVIHEAKRLFEI